MQEDFNVSFTRDNNDWGASVQVTIKCKLCNAESNHLLPVSTLITCCDPFRPVEITKQMYEEHTYIRK